MSKSNYKLTARAAADYAGLPVTVLMRAAKSDPPRLLGYKAGTFGPWYFAPSDVDAWLASMANTTPSPESDEQTAEHAAHARSHKATASDRKAGAK